MVDLHIHGRLAEPRRTRQTRPIRWPVYAVVVLSLLVSIALWAALIVTISAIFHHGP